MMNFSNDLDKAFETKVVKATNKSIRRTAIKIVENLAATTPVDTGLARRNWLTSVSQPVTITKEDSLDDAQKPVTEALGAVSGYDAFSDGDIWISNNLPYIGVLNDGSSIKAPAGFVDAEISNAVRFVKEAFKEEQL